MSYTENETIVPRNVEEEMKESYLRYSMSVIISRALPDVRDGLKPSQRRILYAMRQLNLTPGAKHRKCAKICGDTSGDFHPHGEGVIYPTLARLAQDWVMRYKLINGQGNFGSVDGDPPAAMRYTEAKLTSASIQLMEDLEKDTVPMIPNYDETKFEPTVFPSKFPNLLCNGSSGIAVGMATNIPPHNLGELIEASKLLIEHPDATIDEVMEKMPAPDFPTGGIICGFRGIKEAYTTGRGKLIVRALTRVEPIKGQSDRQRIVIDELPYNVNKSRLIEHIAHLINNKQITGISDIRDESDKDGLCVSIDLKRGEIPDVILNQLYKFSDLQVTFGCNMLALDKGLPRLMNVKHMISAWIEHRIDVVRKRTRFELNRAEARAHILEGYLIALANLDEVVKLIRASDNRDIARTGLMERFEMTERQANAVLELRLYQLTSLEGKKVEEDHKALLEKIVYYKSILDSEELVRGIITKELNDIQSAHKSPRRTQVVAQDVEFEIEDLIPDEPVLLTISEDDYIKRMPINTFREQKRGGLGVKGADLKNDHDAVKEFYVALTHDYLLLFTNFGKCYWLKVWQIPEGSRRSKGKPIINMLERLQEGEKVATILPARKFDDTKEIFMCTLKGVVKKTNLNAFSNPRKNGVIALTIDKGDELIKAKTVEGEQQVMIFTHNGMAVRFDHTQVRSMGRSARGVRGVMLKNGDDHVVGCEIVNTSDSILVVCEKGYGKRSKVDHFRQTKRGGVGVRSIITSERNGKVVGALVVDNEDSVVLITNSGQTIRINMQEVRVMGRSTQGVRLSNLKNGGKLVALQKIAKQKEEINEEEKK
ncbi:MAG: DNA gyrase subunit A [Chlamydiae bacterium]|nr:DNA gyrase subunit A [Chlamydiota bacterium]